MQVTRQKLHSILRKAGYSAAKFSASPGVRGWGEWSPGYQVEKCPSDAADWQVCWVFGIRRATEAEQVVKLQSVQDVLLAAGIDCYPNSQETALIVGDSNA